MSETAPLPRTGAVRSSGKAAKYGKLTKDTPVSHIQTPAPSSTSTLNTDGDVGLSNPRLLIRSISLLIRILITKGHEMKNPPLPNLFSEVYNPLVRHLFCFHFFIIKSSLSSESSN